ncbi:MAG TPA: 3-isopropylmalate dehydratase large subunit [Polyangia bacterium]|nr:3-isopropylmalate dehydratase large subunit [Polyangia bacterium]
MKPRTLFEKIWESHVVRPASDDTPAILYVDLHLIHEVTSPQAFGWLRDRKLKVRRPERTVATMDHSTPTTPRGKDGRIQILDSQAAAQISQLETNCKEFGIELHALGSAGQGIVHVIGPELGVTQPGEIIVCGDSHTSTHGAFGALAFGIGTSEVSHVLATQCLLQQKPKTLAITVEGKLRPGVTAKDLILAVIARLGIGGGTGHVIEYRGSAIRALSMEERMTVCNMSIEAGARAGMIAPDEVTFAYLAGRPRVPQGAAWDKAVAAWRSLPSDEGATYDREEKFDAATLEPMITYGTNPGMGIAIRADVPAPTNATMEKALAYMGLTANQPLLGHAVDVVFIGSCTNSRLSDLQAAASVFQGRKVAAGVRVLVVPGSQRIKLQAEELGLDRIFKDAGADWREAGCSMCIAMNGDQLKPGQYAVSTSNRNFEGRQGAGGRTFLASPLTAAAAAVTGKITDARELV